MIEVVQAKSEHIPQMVALLKELFAIEADFEFDAQKHTQGLTKLIDKEDAEVLVACCTETVVGMCTMQCVISSATGEKSGWVEDVVVDGKYRGRGVGTKLLEQLEKRAEQKNVTRLQLLADTQNPAAIEFYKKKHWHSTQLNAMRKVLA